MFFKSSDMSSIEEIAFLAKLAAARPGLWANIQAKKKRGESAAKPGDEDYPDSKNWSKVTAMVEKQAIAALVSALLRSPMVAAAAGIGGLGAYAATRPTNNLVPTQPLPNTTNAAPPTPPSKFALPPNMFGKTGWDIARLAKQAWDHPFTRAEYDLNPDAYDRADIWRKVPSPNYVNNEPPMRGPAYYARSPLHNKLREIFKSLPKGKLTLAGLLGGGIAGLRQLLKPAKSVPAPAELNELAPLTGIKENSAESQIDSLAKQAVASLNPAQAASASIGSSILNGAQPAMAGHMQTVAKTYDASTPKQMSFNGKPAGQPFYRGDLQQQPGPTNTVGNINANTGVFNRYQGASGHTAQSSSGGRFGTYAPTTAVAAQGGYQKTSGVLQAVEAAGQALGFKGLAKGVSTGFGAFRKPLTTLGNSVPEGILATERNQALQAGNKFLSSFKPEGFNVYAGRVKTPNSIAGHGTEQATNDLLGFRLSSTQGYGQPAVDNLTKQLTDAGVNINSSKMLVRPGYHGYNIKGDLHGSPVEFQLSPRRLQGLNAADHSMVYKPHESGVNPTIGKMYAPLFQYGMTVASPMVPAATRLGYGTAGAGAVGAGGYAATR
jgi:hypothetical protein